MITHRRTNVIDTISLVINLLFGRPRLCTNRQKEIIMVTGSNRCISMVGITTKLSVALSVECGPIKLAIMLGVSKCRRVGSRKSLPGGWK